MEHFNPRAPCGARRDATPSPRQSRRISIHAPLAGRDLFRVLNIGVPVDFNPRAPCGARPVSLFADGEVWAFQSTRPLRGATAARRALGTVRKKFQSTRPLRGATATFPLPLWMIPHFNPRAPCGARRLLSYTVTLSPKFQSTRPLRGATFSLYIVQPHNYNFNPRAPCGARPQRTARAVSTAQFQSTRPLRGATQTVRGAGQWNAISIHAPLAGRDRAEKSAARGNRDFNPRAPCGARLRPLPIPSAAMTNFNPRAPCGARPIFARQKRR